MSNSFKAKVIFYVITKVTTVPYSVARYYVKRSPAAVGTIFAARLVASLFSRKRIKRIYRKGQ